jgi:HD-GYP domain-containing protein (c-di-GMP phosphodiesterase class II)
MVLKPEHKAFIDDQFAQLAAFDDLRPSDRLNKFHDHSKRVAEDMKALARKMGYDDSMCDVLYAVTLIHDIGKMDLPLEIWDFNEKDEHGVPIKPPESLKQERRRHTELGVDRVKVAFPDSWGSDPVLKLACDLMLNHHEMLDGSGYLGKTADDLTQEVQMLCICDAMDGWKIPHPHKSVEELDPIYIINHKMMDGRFNKTILKQSKEIIACQSKPSLSQHSF